MKKILLIIILLLHIGISCNNSAKMEETVAKWMDKIIVFPSLKPFIPRSNDTVHSNINDKKYKILLYMDSTGCVGCKFQMYKWKQIIQETDSICRDAVIFKFYFFPRNEQELLFLLKRDGFDYYPVYIDKEDELNKLNHFSSDIMYQCFLLNKEDKVVAIGNPIHNPKIWELYKQIITGEISDKLPVTVVEPEHTEIELKDLRTGKTSEAVFKLKNTGTQPLVIQTVNASCGCTVPEWEKQPIAAGKSTEIKVKITPEKEEYFNKTVTVHCNTEEGQILLKVKGMVKE